MRGFHLAQDSDPNKVTGFLKGFAPRFSISVHKPFPFRTPCSMKSALVMLVMPIWLVLLAIETKPALAGASPAGWVVVVNGKSKDSRTLANHYCHLRNIPARNVIVLDEIPTGKAITVEEFRTKILGPLLKEIDARRISPHIQGIAYSCDFPTTIQLEEDLEVVKDLPKILTPAGSINGMTYLFRMTMAKDINYVSLDINWYASQPADALLRVYKSDAASQKELAEWIEKGEHEKAAERFDEMRAEVPSPFPLDYLAARHWSLANQPTKALERLSEAIQHGWRFRKQLSQDPAFESLRDDAGFQKLVARCPNEPFDYTHSRGFDARYFYAPNTLESRDPKHGMPYLLSVMLGYNQKDRLSLDESIAMLERSALADFTRPDGAFLFSKNSDVRSTTRQPNFAIAIERLRKQKFDAREFNGILPDANERVSGVMLGISDFDWSASGAKLLPGSIGDNLTSMGGMLFSDGQTKLTELLRNGAAMASGTVTEPYAIQNKFPHPLLYSHYANGLTSAESFYGSILGPYQLLIMGDPLCQPYATPPRFSVEGLKPSEPISSNRTLRLTSSDDEYSVDPIKLQWLVDGQLISEAPFTPKIDMTFSDDEKGAHEWRILAKGPKPIENQYEQSGWIYLGPTASHLRLTGPKQWSIKDSAGLRLQVQNFPPKRKIAIRHDWEIISKQDSDRPIFVVDPDKLGYGPVRLQAVILDDNGEVEYGSVPITVQLKRP